MAYNFKFPDIGEGLIEGVVVAWKVKEGERVDEDQDLVDIETEKAVFTLPSPAEGTVLKIHYKEGAAIRVGDILITIGETGEGLRKVGIKEEKVYGEAVVGVLEEAPEEEEEKPARKRAAVEAAAAGKVLAAPAVRRLAKELKIDISQVKGTGKDGRITEEDVQRVAGKIPPAEKEEKEVEVKQVKKYDMYGYITRVPLKGVKKVVARKMREAISNAALVTHHDDADVTHLVEVRERHKEYAKGQGIKLTYIPFVIKTVIEGLQRYPYLNSTLESVGDEEYIILKKYFNIGVAVDTPDGVIVPVIKGADQKTVLDIAKEAEGLAEKARERKIDLADLKGSTFTITNVGFIGGTYFTPIPNHPEVAVLGLGRIEERPVVRGGKVVVRKVMPLSLTFDHRVVDGADAARFVNAVKEYLEDPDLFLVELGKQTGRLI
ncbi:MAG TPA: dihydrolipoamide acetyltransferase family protein [Candidatus Avalokitesvara rifleensis]|uniref:dihydrolipoamide acetyltransferase family protein n=1 Tax=Candidatus Avalokitesvara rifleensis TaxID=3367620 RepID=UPI002713D439|nr:dihydrolipoamide acetyltransferase family protein [Candidatus Brocadiales bacterium]